MRALKLFGANVLAAGLLVCLVLAGVEAWLRLSIPASSKESIYEYTLETPRYKVMKPSAAVTVFGSELATNDLGFRDRKGARMPAKQPGEFRLVVLGDSFTVSAGVDLDRIYTSLLRDRLRPQHPNLTVLNLAVGGYNIIQYASVLEEVGLRMAPDLILVSLFPENDFNNESYDANYRVASGRERALPSQAWYESLYVYRAYLSRVEAKIRGWLQPARTQAGGGQTGAWSENLRALDDIVERAGKAHIPLGFAMLPHTYHFAKQRSLFRRVADECEQRRLPCLNLLEPFIASGAGESSLRLNALDPHPNERYNAAVADYMTPFLSGLLADVERSRVKGKGADDL